MPTPTHLDYSNRDLRNRSFKNQDLTGADFSGSDIRGCDFRGTHLKGANFQRTRVGQSRKQYITSFIYGGGLLVLLSLSINGSFTLMGSFRGATVSGFFYRGLSTLSVGAAIYFFRETIKTILDSIFEALENTITGILFKRSDLTSANFSYAKIQRVDFTEAKIDCINWTWVSFSQCEFSNRFSHLKNRTIIQLCISRDGRNQNYRYATLKNLHLVGIVLAGANLAGADISGSELNHANLERANLHGIQASGTDFSNAVLTGACIQHWGINAATHFTDVRCDYIYLELNQQERRPASGIFQPGDFAKLVHQFTDTLDFLFRNGIEPQAFDVALRNLLTEYEDAGLSLHSLVDVGDGDRLVKLAVANPTADKASMHTQFKQDYATMQQQLAASREAEQAAQQKLAHAEGQLIVYREQSVFLQGFVYHQTDQFSRPTFNAPNAHFTGDPMSDKRSKIELNNVTGDISGVAGGDISGVAGKDITGAAGGDISGTLTLTLGQLEATKDPDALKLADLLKQLKAAIEGKDAGLEAKDKEKALKHLDAIAKLGGDRTNPDLLERAGDALDALPTIVKRGNGLLEFSEKYLPTITAGIKTVLAAWGVAL